VTFRIGEKSVQEKVTSIIAHMSVSHMHMARIIEAKRGMVAHTAGLTYAVPDNETTFSGTAVVTGFVLEVSKMTASYLSSLADLEDAIADNLSEVMKELNEKSEE
jgi:hypothetical protein